MLFSVTYMIIFGFLLGMTGVGYITISVAEVVAMATVTVVAALAAGAILAGLANWKIFGTGPEAGQFVWKGALFAVIIIWALWFTAKAAGLMPPGTPEVIYILFLGPPVVTMLWGMLAVFMKVGAD